jgi:hypothetical protein
VTNFFISSNAANSVFYWLKTLRGCQLCSPKIGPTGQLYLCGQLYPRKHPLDWADHPIAGFCSQLCFALCCIRPPSQTHPLGYSSSSSLKICAMIEPMRSAFIIRISRVATLLKVNKLFRSEFVLRYNSGLGRWQLYMNFDDVILGRDIHFFRIH